VSSGNHGPHIPKNLDSSGKERGNEAGKTDEKAEKRQKKEEQTKPGGDEGADSAGSSQIGEGGREKPQSGGLAPKGGRQSL